MKIFSSKKSQKKVCNDFITELEKHRQTNDILVINPRPTKYSWMGISVATKSLFKEAQLSIPQYYSNTVFSDEQLNLIFKKIKDLNYEQLILSGFPPYFEKFVIALHQHVTIKVIYHGFFAELSSNKTQIESFTMIIKLAQQGKISSLAFIKAGMGKSISALYGVHCMDLVLPCLVSGRKRIKPQKEIQIGCLVNNSFRKNLHNQAVAALMIENSKIHVFENDDLSYLTQERIVQHKLMSHTDFLTLIGNMDINLHVTYSESWGQVLAESISLGVPCLSAYTSAYFNYDDYLKKQLIVDGFDDSWHIKNKIVDVIENYEEISQKCVEYGQELNEISTDKVKQFITMHNA